MTNNGVAFEFEGALRRGGRPDVLMVPLVSQRPPALRWLAQVDSLCEKAVSRLIGVAGVPEELGQIAHTTCEGAAQRLILVSLGEASKLGAHRVRQAAAAAARWLSANRVRHALLWLDALLACEVEHPAAEWAAGMILGGFRFAEQRKADEKSVSRVRVSVRAHEPAHLSRCLDEIRAARIVADAVNYARTLAHRPPNVLHPASLAAEARELARRFHLRCTVVDAPRAARLGMNGLLAVGAAAAHKPRLIRLDYRGSPRSTANTVLVGKAVTFDSGGLSIKPAAGMEKMKFDKCGGMAVLGTLRAAAALRIRANVTGLIAAAENVLSDEAYRPGDILRMASGKTVEVINTDAEGRLVLADALWYAQKYCRPARIIDLATLTGGVVTALGSAAAGLMSNDDALAAELGESGRRTHERLWRLPLWDDYRELIKSADADIKNSAGTRSAHPIVGGMFLKEFVEDGVPWAHLDIAGAATTDDEKTATGFGVRLLVDFLQRGVNSR